MSASAMEFGDKLANLILDELDIGTVVVGVRLDRIHMANRAGRRILDMFARGARRLPPAIKSAVMQAAAERQEAREFSRAIKLTAPTGTVVYLRTKIVSSEARLVLIALTVRRVRAEDLRELVRRRYNLRTRELDVVALIHQGSSNAEIASQLGLGIATVRTYVSNVLAAFAVRSRTQLMASLRQLGESEDEPVGSRKGRGR